MRRLAIDTCLQMATPTSPFPCPVTECDGRDGHGGSHFMAVPSPTADHRPSVMRMTWDTTEEDPMPEVMTPVHGSVAHDPATGSGEAWCGLCGRWVSVSVYGPAALSSHMGLAHAEETCPCGYPRKPVAGFPRLFSSEWHRRHRDNHLAVFPDVDQGSRDNLDFLVTLAQAAEDHQAENQS